MKKLILPLLLISALLLSSCSAKTVKDGKDAVTESASVSSQQAQGVEVQLLTDSRKQLYSMIEEHGILLYRYFETSDGTPVLDNIESDEESELVSDAFEELLEEVDDDEDENEE